ncbi:class I SAM-dependent methyltransferase [Pseudomonas oryzihabitans]|uniref:class I SAM-dependent methyltransferase n=1 Tax=Pseudomonas oryzihabitans TaxID=47885 RepID=UPI002856C0DF|nr:class I SAM-dependent methyltransferase [Pseudomonas psychrotolerans]MDR6676241.1 SAM-dependent methyltransferase [Pseudomonas psychrotolerans]
MSHEREVKTLFDEWAIEDGAIDMACEHWSRVEPVLSGIKPSAGQYLEIGPGNGYALEYMARTKFAKGNARAVELSQEMAGISAARVRDLNNVHIYNESFLTWQSPANVQFDLIFSMEVFYYFEDISNAIEKAANLLAPGGELIVMVDYFEESEDSKDWPQELGINLTRWPQKRYANAFNNVGLKEIVQDVKIGGVHERGITLCTRGRKPSKLINY